MRVYEAIVKGLAFVGVDAAFGGAGENAASFLLALKHSANRDPATFVQRVYPLVNILTTFFAWGVSHA